MAEETYKVWDKLNGSRETAHDIEAYDAQSAAEKYADEDVDGHIEGLYADCHPICVLDGETVRTFEVIADYSPTFHAAEKSS